MSKEKPEEVIVKKLDKVADSLENTTSQLSSVATQQQLDLIRERIAKCESELNQLTEVISAQTLQRSEKFDSFETRQERAEEIVSALERDHAAVRALVYCSFVLSTVSIVGLVTFALHL